MVITSPSRISSGLDELRPTGNSLPRGSADVTKRVRKRKPHPYPAVVHTFCQAICCPSQTSVKNIHIQHISQITSHTQRPNMEGKRKENPVTGYPQLPSIMISTQSAGRPKKKKMQRRAMRHNQSIFCIDGNSSNHHLSSVGSSLLLFLLPPAPHTNLPHTGPQRGNVESTWPRGSIQ